MSSDTARAATVLETHPFLYAPTAEEAANVESANPLGLRTPTGKDVAEKLEREAHERGVLEGQNLARAAYDSKVATLQSGIGKALTAFQTEQEEYFNRIEPEVVQLALAIAKKILHREAQIDPLLLTGLVHVALEKLEAGSRTRLRANPADIHFWNEHFAQASSGTSTPELVGDPNLQRGECQLETEVGSTQISLDTQLKEIEQGFFDLLEQRPRVR